MMPANDGSWLDRVLLNENVHDPNNDGAAGRGSVNKNPTVYDAIFHSSQTEAESMSTQDRYIDARLAGIESKLDARMDAMQRFQEQAEARFEKAEDRFEGRIGEVLKEMRETRRHASIMSVTTIGVTVGAVIAALAVAVSLMSSQLSEQGAWLRDSVNRIEQRIEVPASTSGQPETGPVSEPATDPPSAE